MTLRCDHWRAQLADRAAGHLADRDADALDRHLAACADCRAELADWQGLRQALVPLDDGLSIPDADLALAKVDALLVGGSQAPAADVVVEPAASWRKAILSAAALLVLGLGLAGLQGAEGPSGSTDSEAQLTVESLDGSGSESQIVSTAVARQARPGVDLRRGPEALHGGLQVPGDAPVPVGARNEGESMVAGTTREADPMPEPDPAGDGLPSGDTEARTPYREPIATPTEVGSAAQTSEPPAMPPPARPPRPPRPPVTEAPPSTATPIATHEPPAPVPTAVARIAGRVEDPAGQGLAWALVFLRPEPDDGRRFLLTDTAGDGSFALSLPAGRYRLVVEAEGFAPTWYGGQPPQVLDLPPDGVLEDLVVRLPAAAEATPSPTQGGEAGSEPLPMPRTTALPEPDPDPGSGGDARLPVDPVPPGSPTDDL